MKQVIFRYGLYGTIAIAILGCIHSFWLMPPRISWETAEVVGYLTMILPMIFVFMGIRYYRDHINNGALSFGEGLKIGVLMVLMPAVFFGLFNILYAEVLDPSFTDNYYSYQVEKIKAATPVDQLEEKLKQLQKDKETFSKPVFQFLFMAGIVFVIGLIVTIISALTLRRNKPTASA